MLFAIIISIIVCLLSIGFSIWYIVRTPNNLRKWYGIPVVIALAILVSVIILLLFI